MMMSGIAQVSGRSVVPYLSLLQWEGSDQPVREGGPVSVHPVQGFEAFYGTHGIAFMKEEIWSRNGWWGEEGEEGREEGRVE